MDGKPIFTAAMIKKVFDDIDTCVIKQLPVSEGRGRKRKSSILTEPTSNVMNGSPPSFVFTRDWRAAFLRKAKEMPMDLLIQEFSSRYNQIAHDRLVSFGGCTEQLSSPEEEPAPEPAAEEHGSTVPLLPSDCVEMILLRLPLFDLLRARFVCHQWADIWRSESLKRNYEKQLTMESCIVLNNSGLDFWAFSTVSMRWFCINDIRCDSWDHKSVKTLGIKASTSGLFLVASSDLTLYVVNPLTRRCRKLPSIISSSTSTRAMKKSMRDMLIHGAVMMKSDGTSGDFRVYVVADDDDEENRSLQIIVYDSTTNSWVKNKVFRNRPSVNLFSPRSRFYIVPGTAYSIISVTPRDVLLRFLRSRGPEMIMRNISTPLPPGMVYDERRFGSCLPITVKYRSGVLMVGRFQKSNQQETLYGRLPIIGHTVLGLWTMVINPGSIFWKFLDVVPYNLMEEFVRTSEGTDVLVTGDGDQMLWFLLRGSTKMLAYNIADNEWKLLPVGCPGNGYMDADVPWRAVYGPMTFNDNI